MAGGEEKPKPSDPWEPVLLLLGALALGAALIWQRGGFASVKNSGTVLIEPPHTISPAPAQNTPTSTSPTQ